MQYRIWIYLIDFGRVCHVYQAFKLGNSSTIGCIRTMVMVMINDLGSTWQHFTTQHPTRNRHLGFSKHGGTHQNHAIFMGKHDPSKSKSITKIRQSSSITKIHQNSNNVPITISTIQYPICGASHLSHIFRHPSPRAWRRANRLAPATALSAAKVQPGRGAGRYPPGRFGWIFFDFWRWRLKIVVPKNDPFS